VENDNGPAMIEDQTPESVKPIGIERLGFALGIIILFLAASLFGSIIKGKPENAQILVPILLLIIAPTGLIWLRSRNIGYEILPSVLMAVAPVFVFVVFSVLSGYLWLRQMKTLTIFFL